MTALAVFGLPMGGGELLIILAVVLILFGPKRLPQLGKSLGKTMKSIRDGVEGKDEEEEPVKATANDESTASKAKTADE